jgi:hypothetical protein
MAAEFELNLERFWFPGTLGDNRSNFRLVVDVRMVRGGKFATDTAVLPGFDTWWECDHKKMDHPNYVRAAGNALDMDQIDGWQRLILLTHADALHSVQVKVFDVDRPDAWDAFQHAFGEIAKTVFGRVPRALSLPDLASEAFGAVEGELRSTVVKRLAGGDRLLFRGSAPLAAPGIVEMRGRGVAGEYSVHLRFEQRPV